MSSFAFEEIGILLASTRPLGLSLVAARAAVHAHPQNPIRRLMEPSASCRACAILGSYPTAILQKTLWLPAAGLDGDLEWEYGAICRVLPGEPHAMVQHPSHPPGQLALCKAAASGWIRMVVGRPRICLVACSAAKLDHPSPARDIYQGELFRRSRAFVERWCHAWAILSAKHWVVMPDEVLEPYDERMPASEERRWRWDQMVSWDVYRCWRDADILLLGGQDYARWLQTGSWSRGISVDRPLAGQGIGQQLAWLGRAIREGIPAATGAIARRDSGGPSVPAPREL